MSDKMDRAHLLDTLTNSIADHLKKHLSGFGIKTVGIGNNRVYNITITHLDTNFFVRIYVNYIIGLIDYCLMVDGRPYMPLCSIYDPQVSKKALDCIKSQIEIRCPQKI